MVIDACSFACDVRPLNDFGYVTEKMYVLKWLKRHIMLFSVMEYAADNKLLLLLMGYTSESATHSFSDWLCAQQTETGRERWCHSLLPQKKKSHNKQGPCRAELEGQELQKSVLLWLSHCKRICLWRLWITNSSMSWQMGSRYNLENITAFIRRALSVLCGWGIIPQTQE